MANRFPRPFAVPATRDQVEDERRQSALRRQQVVAEQEVAPEPELRLCGACGRVAKHDRPKLVCVRCCASASKTTKTAWEKRRAKLKH